MPIVPIPGITKLNRLEENLGGGCCRTELGGRANHRKRTLRNRARAKSRFRPETPAKPSASLLFLNGRPHPLDPLADVFFFAFDGPAGGLLRGSSSWSAQAADLIDMVANAKRALNVFGHAGTGPQIGRESSCSRALEQMLFQPLPLSRGKLARPAAETQIALPSPYARRIDIHGPGRFGLSKSLFQQGDGMLPLAQRLFQTALRSDSSRQSNKGTIGHSLCRNQ
jgi:hypothetical protein